MPVQPLSTIKNWFRTKLKPTQAQFWDTWDSFFHKSEAIPQSAIQDLDTTLQNLVTQDQLANAGGGAPVVLSIPATSSYLLTDGKFIHDIVFIPSSTDQFRIGSTPGGSEYFDLDLFDLTQIFPHLKFNAVGDQTLHFSGSGTLKLYIR